MPVTITTTQNREPSIPFRDVPMGEFFTVPDEGGIFQKTGESQAYIWESLKPLPGFQRPAAGGFTAWGPTPVRILTVRVTISVVA